MLLHDHIRLWCATLYFMLMGCAHTHWLLHDGRVCLRQTWEGALHALPQISHGVGGSSRHSSSVPLRAKTRLCTCTRNLSHRWPWEPKISMHCCCHEHSSNLRAAMSRRVAQLSGAW